MAHTSPKRESESMCVSIWVPQLCGVILKRSTSFLPHPGYWGVLHRRAGGAGRTAASALRGHQRDTDPTNYFIDCIRKSAYELLGIPPTGLQAPPMLWVHHPILCPHPVTNSLCLSPRAARARLCRWLVSMCRKPTWVWGIGRRHTNVSIQHCPGESKPEAVSI